MRLTRATRSAIEKYGEEVCISCHQMNLAGEGGSTIGITNPYITLTTRQADAAINAGREIAWLRDFNQRRGWATAA